MHRVLVIDDDDDDQLLAREALQGRFEVRLASNAEEGIALARSWNPHVMLLDILMPKVDGIATCKMMRQDRAIQHIPIIMLTTVKGFTGLYRAYDAGADDFVTKPFLNEELVARILARIRKASVVRCGNLSLDRDRIQVVIHGEPINLTMIEFRLLNCLIENQTRVLSREQILRSVWHNCVVSTQTINSHIMALRKKLSRFDHVITTVYGAGYILKPAG